MRSVLCCSLFSCYSSLILIHLALLIIFLELFTEIINFTFNFTIISRRIFETVFFCPATERGQRWPEECFSCAPCNRWPRCDSQVRGAAHFKTCDYILYRVRASLPASSSSSSLLLRVVGRLRLEKSYSALIACLPAYNIVPSRLHTRAEEEAVWVGGITRVLTNYSVVAGALHYLRRHMVHRARRRPLTNEEYIRRRSERRRRRRPSSSLSHTKAPDYYY